MFLEGGLEVEFMKGFGVRRSIRQKVGGSQIVQWSPSYPSWKCTKSDDVDNTAEAKTSTERPEEKPSESQTNEKADDVTEKALENHDDVTEKVLEEK